MSPAVTLKDIWIYPIKSLGGVRLERAAITTAGSLHLDREWLVVDPGGRKLWQGDLPRMALTRCRLEPDAIVVEYPGRTALHVAFDQGGPPSTVTQYGSSFAGIDLGDGPAEWLSAAFGATVRLVRIGPAAHGRHDLNPVHVVSTASLAALNERLQARGDTAVEIERFRPNLVIDAPPFLEEEYEQIHFGDAELVFREPCVRCELPNISRVDASRGRQPLKLIGGMSRERPTAAPASFGTYARLTGATELVVGATGIPGARRQLATAS